VVSPTSHIAEQQFTQLSEGARSSKSRGVNFRNFKLLTCEERDWVLEQHGLPPGLALGLGEPTGPVARVLGQMHARTAKQRVVVS